MKTVFFLVKFFDNQNHADDFVHGRIFANRLSRFKKVEDSDESGRMDRHEGTICWVQPGECRLVINGMDMSDDLAGPVQIQKNWLNHLNVFCVHAAHIGDLNLASLSNIESLRQELTIPDECSALGKYAVVVNVPEFINRMRSSAKAKDYRIAWGLVKYYDPATFHGNFRDVESVFWKQDQYRFQREFRFAIDSGSSGECPVVMDIGDIRDITLQLESTELNGKKFLGGQIEFHGDRTRRRARARRAPRSSSTRRACASRGHSRAAPRPRSPLHPLRSRQAPQGNPAAQLSPFHGRLGLTSAILNTTTTVFIELHDWRAWILAADSRPTFAFRRRVRLPWYAGAHGTQADPRIQRGAIASMARPATARSAGPTARPPAAR